MLLICVRQREVSVVVIVVVVVVVDSVALLLLLLVEPLVVAKLKTQPNGGNPMLAALTKDWGLESFGVKFSDNVRNFCWRGWILRYIVIM